MSAYILPVTMIVLGAFLEVYYYFWRYLQDGNPWGLAIVSGVALTAMLNGLSIMAKVKLWPKVLFVMLALYSVVATSSGQAHALGEESRRLQTMDVQASGTVDTIKDLKDEKARILASLPKVTTSLWAKKEYKDEVETDRADRAAGEARIKEIDAQLATLRGTVQAEIPRETIYQYYGRVFTVPADIIQVVLQTILSLFFAIMAPLGIRMLPTAQEPQATVKPTRDWEPFVSIWWDASMVPWKAGKGRMTPRGNVLEFARTKGIQLNEYKYGVIQKAARECGVVELDGAVMTPKIEDRDEAVRLILTKL